MEWLCRARVICVLAQAEKEAEFWKGRAQELQAEAEEHRTSRSTEKHSKSALLEEVKELRAAKEDLEAKVKLERDTREKVAKARLKKNGDLIDKFRTQMIEYEQKVQNL